MLFVFPINNRERVARGGEGWCGVMRRLARASNVRSCNVKECFVVQKEDADNEAKPLPPANISHSDRGEGLTL